MNREILYPECTSCGARDGIHKAVVGPEGPEHMHDVERLVLACGHTKDDPDMRLESGVVDMIRLSSPENIDVRGPASISGP